MEGMDVEKMDMEGMDKKSMSKDDERCQKMSPKTMAVKTNEGPSPRLQSNRTRLALLILPNRFGVSKVT